jgi:adenylosuccinate synthase
VGVGPAYGDKLTRTGIPLEWALDFQKLRSSLEVPVARYNSLLQVLKIDFRFDAEQIAQETFGYMEQLKAYGIFTPNSSIMFTDALQRRQRILFQLAQGFFADLDHGTYPHVTSSTSIPQAVATYGGIPLILLSDVEVIQVAKAYTTRSHAGLMPTELALDDPLAVRIRNNGGEYFFHYDSEGDYNAHPVRDLSTPNRIGYFDGMIMHYGARICRPTQLAITKLDALSGIRPLKIAVGYQDRTTGKTIQPDEFMGEHSALAQAVPIYEELPGWDEDISQTRSIEDLPANAQNYLRKITELTGVPVGIVSVGPHPEQTFRVPPYYF